MKASQYNTVVEVDGDGFLLYNTLYGSMTRLGSTEVVGVLDALNDPAHAGPEVLGTLVSQRHLIAETVDELAILAARRAAGIGGRGRLDVTVMPTLDCNFDCVYCYETRQPGSCMTAEVEARLIRWLERELPTARLALLHWFGGEPLFDARLIHRVSLRCSQIAADAGTTLALHATTNGYLLSGHRRELLLEAGVKEFQITVDGPPRTHNRMRPLRGGHPSFDKVIQNIIDTIRMDPSVQMSLRVNINQDNIEDVEELFDFFPDDVRPRLRLVLEPIFGDTCVSATENLDRGYLSAKMGETYRAAAHLGFEVSASGTRLLTGRRTYCYAERERQYVFGPTGAVFKCTSGSFREEDRLGDLEDDGVVSEYQQRWSSWMALGDCFPNRCIQCVYLPLCMGGCRRMKTDSDADYCTLVPTNAAYVLKQVSLTGTVAGAVSGFRTTEGR